MDLRAALNAMDDDEPVPIQTETVDVYLLRPEESREIELKDFTIMKPKNNKMHRLVRFYPRCQISYRATLPAEEKTVTSPGGTMSTIMLPERLPRHNGGFSNPSRNAEIFRLKRELLKEYYESIQDDDREAAMFDALIGKSTHMPQQPAWASRDVYEDQPEPVSAPATVPKARRSVQKYKPVKVGDEDFVPLTGDKPGSLTLDERVKYVSSLWPGLAPVEEDNEIMDYYGIEVQIISEEEREKELAAAEGEDANNDKQKERDMAMMTVAASQSANADIEMKGEEAAAGSSETTALDIPSSPELSVKTRSAALQKLKRAAAEDDDEIKPNPIATKQDDWVQCDKCQKWRRLPNQVEVSELPAVWYCKMNRWDKRHNKCAAPEEKLVVLMKGADLVEYRQRKFAQDFIQRCKRLEKSAHHYRYTHSHDDDGERKFVQCTECLKLRPLIGGMDPNKVAEPFACWMNWDELLASCSAPEGPLYSRAKLEPRGGNASDILLNAIADDSKGKQGRFSNNNSSQTIVSGGNGRGGHRTGKRGKRKANFEKGSGINGTGRKMKRRTAA